MVADFVRDDVGLGEIAGNAEAAFQLVEETQVEIDFLVFGTIERSDGGAGKTAGRLHRAVEQHEFGISILAAHAAELFVPDIFGIGEHDLDELDELLLSGIDRPALLNSGRSAGLPALRHLLQQLDGVDAEHPGDDQDEHDGAESAVNSDRHAHERAAAAGAALVFDVSTFSFALPTHRYYSEDQRFVDDNPATG